MSEDEDISNSDTEYEVEAIVGDRKKKKYDKKTRKYKVINEYLIKWRGFKKKTWVSSNNLKNCLDKLIKYILTKRIKCTPRIPNKTSDSKRNKFQNSKDSKSKSPCLCLRSREQNKYNLRVDDNESNIENSYGKENKEIIFPTSNRKNDKSKKSKKINTIKSTYTL